MELNVSSAASVGGLGNSVLKLRGEGFMTMMSIRIHISKGSHTSSVGSVSPAVRTAYNAYKSDHPNATKGDMAQWVADASDTKTGAAYWRTPVSGGVRILPSIITHA